MIWRMAREDRPISAPEGTYPLEEWPLDVMRTNASGNVDLSQLEISLSLTPAERLRRLEEFAEFVLAARRANGIRGWSVSRKS